MGTIKQGILGGFSGKVGTVIGSSWKGIQVMRGRSTGRKGTPSDLQLQQQAKFALMIKFLQPLSALLNQTYDKFAVGMSGFNKAFSYNVLNAISGVFPAFTVNFPMVLLGRGDLPNATAPAAISAVAGKLTFNWTDNSGIGKALATDQVVAAAFCEVLDHWIYDNNGAARNTGTFILDVSMFSGKAVQTYLGFISANGKFVANTLFTGAVNVL
ncbi:MAG: DUF6266 family protein [Puia sp.]